MTGRGRLRIYLGAAPGVGKTFAMLNEGRRRRERGTDVVVGIVETHGRAQTAAQLDGMEVVPRAVLAHRGSRFEELDVDAVLARKPAVALVDELAHTNATGSRHAKRWQDIDELLDAGIDVITTVNVQHLESVNDVVERITGVVQRETVPDAWVRAAEQVELVDMTPEALRRRMAHGNVYPAERIDAALGNWFRPGNLTALRELALLWLADRVDDELHDYRARHGIERPWETRERVVVALTGAPGGDQLVRRAARMAARAKAELLAVHVRRDDGIKAAPTELLVRHRALVEELGGRFVEVAGTDVAAALLAVARSENATQIVLGASRRSRLAELVAGSVVGRVIGASGDIDIHVVTTAPTAAERTVPRPPGWLVRLPTGRRVAGWGLAVALPPLLCVALVPKRDDVSLGTAMLLFLAAAVATAAVGGLGPGLVAALAGFLLVNWFFTPPLHTLTVGEAENLFALCAFLAIAGTVSAYVAVSAQRAADAARARGEAATLARLATGGDADPRRLGQLVEHVVEAFAVRGAAVEEETSDGWVATAAAGLPTGPSEIFPVPVTSGSARLVVAGELDAPDHAVLLAFAERLGSVLDAARLVASVHAAEDRRRADELRSAILSAVSHDLRTPLASIKASVSSLLADDVVWPLDVVHDFHESIDRETDRLTALVSDLLDMSRISAGVVDASMIDMGVDELVPAALASLGDHHLGVDADIAEDLPRVRTDPGLVERIIANLVANALAWTPEGGRVRIDAGVAPGSVLVRIVDRGPGIPSDIRDRAFEPFQRSGDGARRTTGGIGLGLAVARGFADAVDAELTLEDTPGGGTTAVLALPIADGTVTGRG